MICRGLNVYFATFFSRKTIIALDPYWLKFFHLTTLGLSLSEKTRKSNRLQMSLQRQHFLLSIKRPPAKCWSDRCVEPATSRSADRRLSSWANRMAKNDQSWILEKHRTSYLNVVYPLFNKTAFWATFQFAQRFNLNAVYCEVFYGSI